jgi:hypothetical protein
MDFIQGCFGQLYVGFKGEEPVVGKGHVDLLKESVCDFGLA